MIDVTGRKPVLLASLACLTLSNAATAVKPCVLTICLQKLFGTLSVGFFVLTTQAIISDIAVEAAARSINQEKGIDSSSLVSSAMGVQIALTGCGFLMGIIGAGQLSELGLPIVYGVSAFIGTVAMVLTQFGLSETLPVVSAHGVLTPEQSSSLPKKRRFLLQSPLSCARLLTRHGKDVRILGILLMLMTLPPMFMGDFFQIFAKSEWNLSTKRFSSLLALFGVVGIVANASGEFLVRKIGIKKFTYIAIFSRLKTSFCTAFFGCRGSIIGMIVGFLGAAQSIGIVAALIFEGTKS
jgi:predicted MFS family arabinose efflux permease